MADQSRSSLTSFVTGDLTPATLSLAMINLSVKEQRRFGAGEIVEFSRERITDRPECTPFEIRTVAEMCMLYPEILTDSQHDGDTIQAVEEAERLFRRLGDQAGIDRSVAEKTRLRTRMEQAGTTDLSWLTGLAAPQPNRIEELSREIDGLLGRGEFERAMEPVAEYSELARTSGDKKAILAGLNFQSQIVSATGDGSRTSELMAEQQALLKEIEDPELTAKANLNNGLGMLQTGQFDQAREILQGVVRESRERGYAAVEGSALWGLGGIACQVGPDLPAALDCFRDSVAAFQRVMDGRGMAKSLAFQAQVLAQLGRVAEAQTLIGRAHQLASTLQMTQEIEALIDPVRAYVESEAGRAGISSGQPEMAGVPGGRAAGTPSLEQAKNAWALAQYEYMKALAEWKALPFLKRRKTPKPQPPQL
jgi:tetratricopeptide (TPR) repeat protein